MHPPLCKHNLERLCQTGKEERGIHPSECLLEEMGGRWAAAWRQRQPAASCAMARNHSRAARGADGRAGIRVHGGSMRTSAAGADHIINISVKHQHPGSRSSICSSAERCRCWPCGPLHARNRPARVTPAGAERSRESWQSGMSSLRMMQLQLPARAAAASGAIKVVQPPAPSLLFLFPPVVRHPADAMKVAIALLCLIGVASAATEHRRPPRPVPVFCAVRS